MRTPHYRKKEDPCETRWEDLCRKWRGAKWCSSIKQNKGSYFTILGSQHITKRFIHLKFLVQHISVMKVEELSVKRLPFLIVIIQMLMVLMNSDSEFWWILLPMEHKDAWWELVVYIQPGAASEPEALGSTSSESRWTLCDVSLKHKLFPADLQSGQRPY